MSEQKESQSQVREIIDQLNEEHPSKERSRELVVRKDGTKVVRVTKKRRVTISEKEKKRTSRRKFTLIFGIFFVLIVGSLSYIGLKVGLMGGSHYLDEKKEEIRLALKAESIQLVDARIEGFDLRIAKIVAKYPSGSQLDSVELEQISGTFDVIGVIQNKLFFESLNIGKATCVLKEGADVLETPATTLFDICSFSRIDCKSFNLFIGDVSESPLSIYDTNAYLYYPDYDKSKIVFSCRGGQFVVRNWLEFDIKDLRAAFIDGQQTDLSADLTMMATETQKQGATVQKLSLKAKLSDGDTFYGPYSFECSNISIEDLTKSRMLPFFKANTKRMVSEDVPNSKSELTFSAESKIPTIISSLDVGDISWFNLPALQEIQKHVESSKRSLYAKVLIPYGHIELTSSPDAITMSFKEGEMKEPYSISLVGKVSIDSEGNLSGDLEYGVPASLTRREYPDGLSDPIFAEEGSYAWFRTTLAGTNLAPEDNSLDLHLKAEGEREKRPKPNRLDVISIDIFADRLNDNKIEVE